MNAERGGLARRPFSKWFRSPEALVFLLYACVTALFTYPAITLVSRTYAERRDPLGVLWLMWWFKYAVIHHLPTSPASIVAVPFSLNINQFSVDPLTGYALRLGALVSTETIAYNIFLLLSFFLAAVFTYYLVKHLTASRLAAAFSGFAFAFSPYMLTQGKEHINLVATFWIPIFILALVKAWQRRTPGSIAWCVVAFLFLALFNTQYGLFCGIFAVAFLVTAWLAGGPWRRDGKAPVGFSPKVVAIVGAVVVVLTVLFVTSRSLLHMKNQVEALYMYSARPWDYFIPHAEGALFGSLTRGFIYSHLHGGFSVENSLFLGYIPLLLAIIGVVGTFWKRQADAGDQPADSEGGRQTLSQNRKLVVAFTVTALIALIFSMPPTARIFAVKLYFPSYFLFKVIPQFRAYARFGVITMICVVVLAGYGISFLEKRGFFGRRRTLIVALLSALVLLEFTIVPPFYSLDTAKTTAYYRWLKRQPGKLVAAVYPLYFTEDFYNYNYFFQQRIHQKSLVNGAQSTGFGDLYRQSILDITNPATPGLLKNLGTKYVLVITSFYTSPIVHSNYVFPTNISEDKVAPGLVPVQRFGDCFVCEVTAQPAEFVPIFEAGSYTPYNDPEGKFWHPCIREAVVSIESKLKQPTVCDIRLRVMSARSSSAVTFELNGRAVATVEAPVWPVDVAVRGVTLNPGRNTLVVNSDGRLANLTEVPGYSSVMAAMMLSDIQVEGKQ